MKRYALTVASLLIISFGSVPNASAQDTDSGLVGTWTLSIVDSDFGGAGVPDSVFMSIERADEQLVMRRDLHFSQVGEPRTVTFDMPIDGGTHDAMTNDGAQEVRVSWDGDVLVTVTEVEANVGMVEVTDRLKADDDGRTLTQERLMDVPSMGVMESTLVFLRDE